MVSLHGIFPFLFFFLRFVLKLKVNLNYDLLSIEGTSLLIAYATKLFIPVCSFFYLFFLFSVTDKRHWLK